MRQLVLALCIVSCSSSSTINGQPVEVSPRTQVVVLTRADMMQMPVPELMSIGLKAFSVQQYPIAIQAFEIAIDTDSLNLAGRAVSYWVLGNSYMVMGDVDSAMDSFMGFTVVGQDIMDIRDEVKFAVTPDGKDFVDNFDLETKLSNAVKYLNDTWSAQKE